MPELVISNTSPLFYLHRLRLLDLLEKLYQTGTAGVLLKAKQEGHVSAVAPLLNRLTQLGFRLGDAVKASILRLAQE